MLSLNYNFINLADLKTCILLAHLKYFLVISTRNHYLVDYDKNCFIKLVL